MDHNRLSRRKEGFALHEIESNPLDAADRAMFEMFDAKGFSDKERRDYIIHDAKTKLIHNIAAE